jgi:hypothetical protein
MSVLRPDMMMKCVVPVIMAGIIAVSHLSPQLFYEQSTEGHLFALDLRPCRFGPHRCRTYDFIVTP